MSDTMRVGSFGSNRIRSGGCCGGSCGAKGASSLLKSGSCCGGKCGGGGQCSGSCAGGSCGGGGGSKGGGGIREIVASEVQRQLSARR